MDTPGADAPLTLTGASSLALLAAEVTAGALAPALCIRVYPARAIRAELQLRLASAGLLGPSNGRQRRAALPALDPPNRAIIEARR